MNNFFSNRDDLLRIYRNSGKDYNDFGRYKDCLALSDYSYFLASINKDTINHPISIGLCLPARCKEEDLNQFKPYVIPALN